MSSLYHGWIPTVSGALSFSAFGESSHPPRPISGNRADRETRYLICYRGKDASDILLPFKGLLASWFLGLNGKIWFLCIGKSSVVGGTQEKIEGNVFIFHDRKIWRQQALPHIRRAQDHLRCYKFGVHGSIEDYFQGMHADLSGRMPSLSAFNASFTIQRDGTAELIVPAAMVKHELAPQLPSISPHKEHVEHILAAQLFFFLRDIGHRHQHHDPHTDTIVDLWLSKNGDTFNWKLQTLFSLYRKIISYKRVSDPAAYAASMGVVAYAKTFREIVEAGAEPDQAQMLPRFFAENVADSIDAVTAEMQRRLELKQNSRSVTRELTLAALALLVAIVGVFQITDLKVHAVPSSALYFLGQAIVTQPIVTLCAVAALILITRVGTDGAADAKFNRWLLRLTQPLDLRVSIAIFFAFGVALLMIIFFLLTLG